MFLAATNRKKLKRAVITFLVVILVIGLVAVNNVATTAAYFNDIEGTATNGVQGWIASLWTQTSQADFEAGVSSQVDTASNPGDVILDEESSQGVVASDDFESGD